MQPRMPKKAARRPSRVRLRSQQSKAERCQRARKSTILVSRAERETLLCKECNDTEDAQVEAGEQVNLMGIINANSAAMLHAFFFRQL